MNTTKPGPKVFMLFGDRFGVHFGPPDLYLLQELVKEIETEPGGLTLSEKLEKVLLDAGETREILSEKSRGKKLKGILRKRYSHVKTW